MNASFGRHAARFVAAHGATSILVSGAFIAATAVAALISLQQIDTSVEPMNHADAILRGADALELALFDIDANQRGYQLSGDPAYLDACRSALHRAQDAAGSIQSLTEDNLEVRPRVAELMPLVERRLGILRAAMAERNGRVQPAAERPFHDENPLLDQTRTLLNSLRATERAERARWSQQAQSARSWLRITIPVTLSTTVAAALGAVLLLRRSDRARKHAETALQQRDEIDRRREAAAVTDAAERRALEAEVGRAQKLEAVGRLAGGIAHDFNNLLTIINGCVDLLRLQRPADDPQHELLEAMHSAGERAAGLTRQLLTFGRRRIYQPRVLDLNAVVADMAKLLGRLIGEDITLELTLEPGSAPVRGDQAQLEQLVMNLALNARDAMPQGGRLEIRTRRVELDAKFATTHLEAGPGPYVLLSVSDTGIGITPTVHAHLFEPFFTTKGPGKGTGLGLATVYTVVKEAGGAIDFITAPGEGTTVHVYLPRADAVDPAPVAAEHARAAAGGETVLVVEDEPSVRKLIAEALRSRGYTVLDASNGIDALRTAAGHDGPIHLLVTDVVMPHLSGRALAEHLAALRPGLKVLYLSGYTDDAMARHGIGAGAAFLQKPFTPEALAAQVRSLLQ